ncbi:hypothetical protein [Streptomyces roseirectus]|uniref:hypothetical protein n=1 Tax=Streptomyces roseirectus TaxID=2768066 RepID=UPI001FE659CB|nr:hypothetical protein [Streptomyces roseirectus]
MSAALRSMAGPGSGVFDGRQSRTSRTPARYIRVRSSSAMFFGCRIMQICSGGMTSATARMWSSVPTPVSPTPGLGWA